MLKLQSLGIRGKLLKWFGDFLYGRFQKVRVNEGFSEWVKVSSGVPQGSVLGPVLFLTYINDLPEALDDIMIRMFADDAKLAKVIVSPEDVTVLQQNINKATEWSETWSLQMNSIKCKALHLSRHQTPCKNVYTMHGNVTLDAVDFEKDRGVYVDEQLKFEEHISNSIKKANKMTGIIYRNFKMMGQDVFMNLYKTLVRPHLEYGSVVWSPSTIRDQRKVESIQRRATKLVPNIRDLSYEQRLKKLGIPSLQYRRQRADMIQVYKILHGIDRVDPVLFFQMAEEESRTRGHKYKIKN